MHTVHPPKLNENNIKMFVCVGYHFVDNTRTFKLNWTSWLKDYSFQLFYFVKHINNTGQNPLKDCSDSTAPMKDPFLH